MKGIVCNVCGYIAINGETPRQCPVCGSKSFTEKDDAFKTPADKAESGETEKKHIPDIKVVKQCGLIPEGCQDVHVKVGQITHPMTPEHSIQHIDFYLDREFISRVTLTPEKLNPAAGLHLRAKSGKVAAMELCNIHGAWFNQEDL